MEKIENAGIYVDGYNLRTWLKRAQFVMTKADRIVYGTPALKTHGKFMADFVMAYDFPEEREYYIKKMFADFEVLKIDLRIIVNENILKGTDKDHCNVSADTYKREIFECVARIDDGINKWRNSLKKGKTRIA